MLWLFFAWLTIDITSSFEIPPGCLWPESFSSRKQTGKIAGYFILSTCDRACVVCERFLPLSDANGNVFGFDFDNHGMTKKTFAMTCYGSSFVSTVIRNPWPWQTQQLNIEKTKWNILQLMYVCPSVWLGGRSLRKLKLFFGDCVHEINQIKLHTVMPFAITSIKLKGYVVIGKIKMQKDIFLTIS